MTQFSRTWWGQLFLDAVEGFSDPNRLTRGRAYARNGKIIKYSLAGSAVTAKVRGSVNPYWGVYREPIYHVEIELTPIKPSEWKGIIAALAGNAGTVAQLLMNEMPDTIDDTFAKAGGRLLPMDEDDFSTLCSCPDWGNPCKHVAGVLYLLAGDLDRDPFLLFELRGLSRQKLVQELVRSPLGKILAEEMVAVDTPVAPDETYYTRPTSEPVSGTSYDDFWTGPRRLPEFEPAPAPGLPGLLVKRQGDFPPFWRKDSSFIATMVELYDRVRAKSSGLK